MSDVAPRVVVTRSRRQAEAFGAQLTARGFTPLLFPVIQFVPLPAPPLNQICRRLARADWVLFTSVNGVEFFWKLGPAALNETPWPRVAAVGEATAARLRERERPADYVPDTFTGTALAAGLGDLTGRRVLLPRARRGRPEIVQLLTDAGAVVDELPLYDTVTAAPAPAAVAALAAGFAAITFTSPSSVRNFMTILERLPPAPRRKVRKGLDTALVACIGPVTTEAAAEAGLTVATTADPYTIPALIEALARRLLSNRSEIGE